MEVVPGYVTWCEECNWNIDPNWRHVSSLALFDRINFRMGIKKSHQLLEENLQADRITYPFTWSKDCTVCWTTLLQPFKRRPST
ncbi:hypothetical protein M3650_04125 [Paenibacillus sp. MER TA 81-3]|uniref:hypothetical protein n=1 Tax=Paenibacillus sp. MER TA 81-3 TaxID=2939573 RepID=UPI00203BD8B6|nr:hypothetical protein [Paenibacillus sp. MER TA 81-3]MCM3337841.1 hypothetical protein [Paenibacillus sp. MER TA 81-3]